MLPSDPPIWCPYLIFICMINSLLVQICSVQLNPLLFEFIRQHDSRDQTGRAAIRSVLLFVCNSSICSQNSSVPQSRLVTSTTVFSPSVAASASLCFVVVRLLYVPIFYFVALECVFCVYGGRLWVTGDDKQLKKSCPSRIKCAGAHVSVSPGGFCNAERRQSSMFPVCLSVSHLSRQVL